VCLSPCIEIGKMGNGCRKRPAAKTRQAELGKIDLRIGEYGAAVSPAAEVAPQVDPSASAGRANGGFERSSPRFCFNRGWMEVLQDNGRKHPEPARARCRQMGHSLRSEA